MLGKKASSLLLVFLLFQKFFLFILIKYYCYTYLPFFTFFFFKYNFEKETDSLQPAPLFFQKCFLAILKSISIIFILQILSSWTSLIDVLDVWKVLCACVTSINFRLYLDW